MAAALQARTFVFAAEADCLCFFCSFSCCRLAVIRCGILLAFLISNQYDLYYRLSDISNEKYQRSLDSIYKDWHLLSEGLTEQQSRLQIHRRTHL